MKTTGKIHKEVVTGLVQVMRYLDDRIKEGDERVSFIDLLEAGHKGRTEEAQDYITEFVKDSDLRPEDIKEVVQGNYERLWKTTNNYLKGRGYEPVEPEPISPDLTTK